MALAATTKSEWIYTKAGNPRRCTILASGNLAGLGTDIDWELANMDLDTECEACNTPLLAESDVFFVGEKREFEDAICPDCFRGYVEGL